MGVDHGQPDAVATLAAFKRGELAPAAYAEGLAERVSEQRHLNALAQFDIDYVTSQAARAFEAQPDAPLAGLPLVAKDNINTRSYPTTAGTAALAGHTPAADAGVVEAISNAGGFIGAKSNLHELAFGITSNNAVTGAVRNPHDNALIAGGSSGGTAAAVASGVFPLGLGTDTGGSCRIPAALCGVVGFRPTTERYSRSGVVPVSHTRDTVGPIARSVRDVVLLDGVLSGGQAGADTVPVSGVTLGVPRRAYYDNLDPHVGQVIEAQLDRLASAGVRLVEVSLDPIGSLNEAVGFPVALYEVMRDLPAYLADHAPHLSFDDLVRQIGSPDVAGVIASQLGDEAIPESLYRDAIDTHRPAMQAHYRAVFDTHGLDALVFPTTPLPARPIGEDETVELNGVREPTFQTYIRNTDPGSNLGAPGISLPCPTGSGLPVGLELDGLPDADDALLSVALAVEPVLRA